MSERDLESAEILRLLHALRRHAPHHHDHHRGPLRRGPLHHDDGDDYDQEVHNGRHRTKQIRGLLCKQCNSGIGYLKDSVEMLEKAILYLNSPRKIAPSFNGDVYTLMKFYFQGKFREKKEKEEVS